MDLPPPLRWVEPFCVSTGAALGQKMGHELRGTVNPLVFQIHLQWGEPISPELRAGVWNLFQIWAHKNETIPQGKTLGAPYSLSIDVAIKRRLGAPRMNHPLG